MFIYIYKCITLTRNTFKYINTNKLTNKHTHTCMCIHSLTPLQMHHTGR